MYRQRSLLLQVTESISTLSYAIRPLVVVKYLGQLVAVFALLLVVPLIIAVLSGESAMSLHYLALIVLLLLAAFPTRYIPQQKQIHPNEAMVTTALIFMISAGVMTYPGVAIGIAPIDALFESVSGITTTGLSTLVTLEDKPQSYLFARAWLQWCGGLGIVVLSIAFLGRQQTSARRLMESIGGETLDTTARTYARRMLAVYLVLTLCGFVLVWLLMGDAFLAMTHTLAAISTGGFSPFDASLASLKDWPTRYSIIALSLLGALPFPLFYFAFRRRFSEIFEDLELRALIVICLIACTVIYFSLWLNTDHNWPGALKHAALLGLSAQTTTGFTSLPIQELDDLTKVNLIISMFVGGGMASTAGGVKVIRLLVLLRLIQIFIQRTAMPVHAVTTPRLGGRPLETDEIQRATVVILLYIGIILSSWVCFIIYGYAPLDALFEVVSAIGTVGLSCGIATPDLEPVLKLILCFDMLAGRLEIIALLVLWYPHTWFGIRVKD
jgi:trk system potassium uptake protein TrkH